MSQIDELAARVARGEKVPGLSVLPAPPQASPEPPPDFVSWKQAWDEYQIKYKTALETAMNLTQGTPATPGLCQAEAHSNTADLELARATRRAALNVLKSLLEKPPS